MNNDDVILRALEVVPVVDVPEDFAARVMARLPQRPRRMRLAGVLTVRPSLGRVLIWMGVALLLAAMLWIAPRSLGSVVWLWMQVLLFVEFSGLLLWFVQGSTSVIRT